MIMDSNQEKNCLKGLGYAQFKKQLIPSGNQLDSFLANDSARESYPTSYIRTIQSHGPGGTLPHKLGHHQCKLFLPFLQVQISSGTFVRAILMTNVSPAITGFPNLTLLIPAKKKLSHDSPTSGCSITRPPTWAIACG
jgi:hypothetical protein